MTPRRKTPRRLTMAALSLAAALALQTGPAVAQPTDDEQLAVDESGEQADNHAHGHPIWCWPLYWLIHCWTR